MDTFVKMPVWFFFWCMFITILAGGLISWKIYPIIKWWNKGARERDILRLASRIKSGKVTHRDGLRIIGEPEQVCLDPYGKSLSWILPVEGGGLIFL